jgi:NADPH-dependent methylglyoxal reductase
MTPTILIIGGSGFIGGSILDTLLNTFLNAGYHVRASAFSSQSAELITQNHRKLASGLTFVIVLDITLEGAFDEAVEDTDGVIHVASPCTMVVTNFATGSLQAGCPGYNHESNIRQGF